MYTCLSFNVMSSPVPSDNPMELYFCCVAKSQAPRNPVHVIM